MSVWVGTTHVVPESLSVKWGYPGEVVGPECWRSRLNKKFADNYLSQPRLITGEVEEGLAVDEVEV